MTAKEAYEIFKVKRGDLVVLSCYEYDSRFVFQAVTPKYAKLKTGDVVLDCLYSVEKKSGKLESFKPFNISVDEYRRGKKVSFK